MPNHGRIALWTAICAAVVFAPVHAEASAGVAALSDGMAGVQRSLGSGDNAGASAALGGLFDAGGGGFAAATTAADATGERTEAAASAADLRSAELHKTARQAWAGNVPAPEHGPDGKPASPGGAWEHLARLSSEIVKTIIIIESQLETATEKAAKAVDDEGARRAREGAIKQREAEKKWEGKERNYPQYEKK